MVHKTLQGKLKIEQDELKTGIELSYTYGEKSYSVVELIYTYGEKSYSGVELSNTYGEKSYSVIRNTTRKKEGIVTIARGAHP